MAFQEINSKKKYLKKSHYYCCGLSDRLHNTSRNNKQRHKGNVFTIYVTRNFRTNSLADSLQDTCWQRRHKNFTTLFLHIIHYSGTCVHRTNTLSYTYTQSLIQVLTHRTQRCVRFACISRDIYKIIPNYFTLNLIKHFDEIYLQNTVQSH